MILTQTYYSKVSGLVTQRESQVLEETMALIKSVLKQAHRRGVELKGILEVQKQDTVFKLIYIVMLADTFLWVYLSQLYEPQFSSIFFIKPFILKLMNNRNRVISIFTVMEQACGRLPSSVQTVRGCGV